MNIFHYIWVKTFKKHIPLRELIRNSRHKKKLSIKNISDILHIPRAYIVHMESTSLLEFINSSTEYKRLFFIYLQYLGYSKIQIKNLLMEEDRSYHTHVAQSFIPNFLKNIKQFYTHFWGLVFIGLGSILSAIILLILCILYIHFIYTTSSNKENKLPSHLQNKEVKTQAFININRNIPIFYSTISKQYNFISKEIFQNTLNITPQGKEPVWVDIQSNVRTSQQHWERILHFGDHVIVPLNAQYTLTISNQAIVQLSLGNRILQYRKFYGKILIIPNVTKQKIYAYLNVQKDIQYKKQVVNE